MSVITITKDTIEAEVINSSKPVLLDFFAPWCGPCRMLTPVVEEIAAENPDIKVAKVNIDDEPELTANFGVVSVPTLFVIKNGQIENQTSGVLPKQAILDMFK